MSCQVKPGRYALIADESVSIGQEKLLVLLLVKLGGDRESRVARLSMSDVSVLHVESKASWKGAEIAEAIEDRLKECEGAEIAYSISDKGSNLLSAFKTCNMEWVSDCTHVISNCTQALFQKDVALNELVKSMNATRAKWALSDLAIYIPPPPSQQGALPPIVHCLQMGAAPHRQVGIIAREGSPRARVFAGQ